jgi:hypothetical protein
MIQKEQNMVNQSDQNRAVEQDENLRIQMEHNSAIQNFVIQQEEDRVLKSQQQVSCEREREQTPLYH